MWRSLKKLKIELLYASIWRREGQHTPVFLPGESHGQRSLVGYSSWACKGSDMTERLNKNNNVRFYAFMAIIAIIGYKNA